jgi:glycosyltransferase involved in cell wall biosynthesis
VKRVSVLTPCFRSEAYLEGYFEAVLAQTVLAQVEVVLVLNEPSSDELAIVERMSELRPGLIRVVVFPEDWDPARACDRGPRSIALVSESYNRAWLAATGEYVAQWDHDDLRTPRSLEAEMRTLDQHPEALMTYGDMVMVRTYGDTEGELLPAPDYDRDLFMRGCMGAFRMWRRSALEAVGPFDEQFLSGGDFDLWVRFAAMGEQVRTAGVLGYWLNARTGLSTSGDGVQPIERTVVELRYGILDKIDRRYLGAASRYRIGEIRFRGEWVPLERYVPGIAEILARAAVDPRHVSAPGAGATLVSRLRGAARRARAVLRPGGGGA